MSVVCPSETPRSFRGNECGYDSTSEEGSRLRGFAARYGLHGTPSRSTLLNGFNGLTEWAGVYRSAFECGSVRELYGISGGAVLDKGVRSARDSASDALRSFRAAPWSMASSGKGGIARSLHAPSAPAELPKIDALVGKNYLAASLAAENY